MVIKGNILMAFIKNGDDPNNKILKIIEGDNLTDDQKKSVEKISLDSNQLSDSSQQKKSGTK
jgi:hypothetical protein